MMKKHPHLIGWVLSLCVLGLLCPAPAQTSAPAQVPEANPPRSAEPAPVEPAAPAPRPRPPAALGSPRDTMFTFLRAMEEVGEGNEQAWAQALSTFDLSESDLDPGSNQARFLALGVLGVLNRLEEVRPNDLPGREEAQARDLDAFVYFPSRPAHDAFLQKAGLEREAYEISLIRTGDGVWKFSPRTVATMPGLYDRVQHLDRVFGADETRLTPGLWLRQYVPDDLKGEETLGLELWQWLGLLGLILLGLVVDVAVRGVVRLVTRRVLARQDADARGETIGNAVRPLGLLAAGLAWLALLHVLNLPDLAQSVLLTAVRLFTALAGTWAAWRVTDLVTEVLAHKAAGTRTRYDDVLIPLLRKSLKIFIVVVGAIWAAYSVDVNVLPMLTGLGIGGLAFAFAAKDTIENFFGSVAVLLDRPFEVGDWVVIGDVEGTVEEVGFRSTRVRTFYNSQVTVPNATLVRATVDNYGRRHYRRCKTNISIRYDTPPEKIVAFTEGIRELVRTHPYTRKDSYQVYLNEFGASSLEILLYIFYVVPDWSTELRERERIFLDVIRLADRLGVQFAFPTQTVHLVRGQRGEQEPAYPAPDQSAERQAQRLGIREVRELIAQQPWRDQPPAPVTFNGDSPPEVDDEEDQVHQRTAGS